MFMPAAAAAVMAINKTNFPPDIHVNAHTANLSRVCAVIHWVVCRGHSALKVPHIKELVPVPFCSFQKEHVQFISSVPTTSAVASVTNENGRPNRQPFSLFIHATAEGQQMWDRLKTHFCSCFIHV